MVKARRRRQRGQSIIEYLVVVAAVIAIILGLGQALSSQVQNVSTNASTSVGNVNVPMGTEMTAVAR